MSVVAPYVWRHPDGRRIEVYPDKKVWFGRGKDGRGRLALKRSEVEVTDEQWYASPGPEWTGCSYNDLPPNENIPIQR